MSKRRDVQTLLNEISGGHQVMINVLENRKIKIEAALTFWKKQDFTQLLTYLLQTNDDGLFVDVLPLFTKRLIEDDKDRQKKISLGSCLELLPALTKLLFNKYEIYICTSLDLILAMIKRWYFELRAMKNKSSDLNSSLSLPEVYIKLISLQERLEHLSSKPGNVGKKSKVVFEMIQQLQ